ncbi:ribosome assembly cofactor RimP, partial [Bacteroidota bacterium]
LVEQRIEDTHLFLVNVKIGKASDVRVQLDSLKGVDIDECVEISRWLSSELDLIEENYSLEVSSPGIGEPFKVMQQYEKNVGREVEVLLKEGEKKKGILTQVNDASVTLEMTEKVISENNKKKKKKIIVENVFEFDDIKSTKEVIKF